MIRLTELAHERWRAVLRPGDMVVDATVGNGHDTLVLARLVGPTGRVIGFDIQPDALFAARQRLDDAGFLDARLYFDDHRKIAEFVTDPVRVVCFNLGYLPGGNKSITTRVDSTLDAIGAAAQVLVPGGLITVIGYRGHAGGAAETDAVRDQLNSMVEFAVEKIPGSESPVSPVLFVAAKRD